LRGREGFGVLSPSRRACEAGFRRFRGDEMLNFLYTEGYKKWRGRGKHSMDTGHMGDRRWPWRLSVYPSSASYSGGDRRGGARATNADVSVCRSVREGRLRCIGATYAELRLSQRRQMRLSQLHAASTLSGPCLLRWARVRCVCVTASVGWFESALKLADRWRSTTRI
jgi:hypothetical protein